LFLNHDETIFPTLLAVVIWPVIFGMRQQTSAPERRTHSTNQVIL
jgi:hypothetical protein